MQIHKLRTNGDFQFTLYTPQKKIKRERKKTSCIFAYYNIRVSTTFDEYVCAVGSLNGPLLCVSSYVF